MTTNAAVDVRSLFSVKLASIFQTNAIEMDKLKTQLQQYGTNPVGSWQKLFANCIRAITFSSNPIERVDKYKPKFIAELQLKYSNIDDFLNNKTKNEFVVLFAETLSTILQAEEPEEPVVEQKESAPYVETDDERKKREEKDEIFRINQAAARDMEEGDRQIGYRNETVGGSLHKKTPRRRKYSKRNNTRRKRTARKRRSYK